MQGELQIFLYQEEVDSSYPFRTVEVNGELWFYIADICKALGLSNSREVARSLEKDDVSTTDGIDDMGRKQTFNITNEAGLYQLIFQSRKEGAKKFKRWVTHEVLPAIRRTGSYSLGGKAFVRRFNNNWDRTADGYFSIISELGIRLYGRFEQLGHIIRDRSDDDKEIRPDVSVGRLFSDYLKKNSFEDVHLYYLHWTPQGEFPARQYPVNLLPTYIDFLDKEWIPKHAKRYFRTRDPNAIPYIPQLTGAGKKFLIEKQSKKK